MVESLRPGSQREGADAIMVVGEHSWNVAVPSESSIMAAGAPSEAVPGDGLPR